MGNATTICSDKTGTLTKNRMTVVRVYTSATDFKQPKEAKALDASIVDAIGMSAAINSQFKSLYTIEPKTGLPNQQGNKVSRAPRCGCGVVAHVCADGVCHPAVCRRGCAADVHGLSPEVPRVERSEGRDVIAVQHASNTHVQIHPFSSAKKRMSTIVRLNGGYRMFVKGASEILLPLCATQVKGASTEALSAADIVWCC
jgi:magnesium-transporting ATPase (P-type)